MRLHKTIVIVSLMAATSCAADLPYATSGGSMPETITITFQTDGLTKSESPDEDLVTDMNIFILNSYGLIEDSRYLRSTELVGDGNGAYRFDTQMLQDCRYSVYACANTGFALSFDTLEELLGYRYYLAYPDDYRIGVPMSGIRADFLYSGESEIAVPLRRAMSKVSVSIDRSALNPDVDMEVTSVTVGNCPKSVLMFADNVVSGTDDTYNVGFRRSGNAVDILNRNVSGQVSGEVSLYMFENMQGSPLGDITDYADKEFVATDPRRDRCSYIELVASYLSDEYYSLPGEGLVYRFYIGDGPSDFNVQRNCHYHVALRPEGSGLNGSGWRVDKSGLEYCGQTGISVSPSTYIRGKVGDVVDVRVTTVPEDAPLDLGYEELEFDRERGIYDYVPDSDGRGVTLTLMKSGTGLLYFEAGAPVNDAALVMVEVDLI